MKRLMLAAVASVAVVAFVPASALARHHSRHHHSHHARHHARIRRFGDVGTPGTPAPTSPSSAGQVTDFSNGVLTITLTDGTVLKGAVTPDTEIECMAPDTGQTMQTSDGPGDQNSGGNDGGSSGGDNQGSDQGDNSGTGDDDQNQNANCSSANLTDGTMVAGAELKIEGSGNVWDKVELISSSTSTTSGGDS